MATWNGKAAAQWLDVQGYDCHYRRCKSANYSVKGGSTREISVALERQSGVTAYVNQLSVSGIAFPHAGIVGIEIAASYLRGYRGLNGNRGISDSVARQNPSLNPMHNDVLRLHVQDMDSLSRLMRWYTAT